MRPSCVLGGPAVLLLLSLPVVYGMAGCSSATLQEMLPGQSVAYKKSRLAEENLELPPDLKSANFDDAMDVPTAGGGATYSQYAGGRAQRQQAGQPAAGSGAVLPAVENVELRRSGDSRWLEVGAIPPAVWPRVVAFWREQGILLVDQNPAVGVMKTDWIENRAEVPTDFVTKMIRKVADGLYATATRDQYTVRMEAGSKPGTTEVHLTHKGMEEKIETGTLGDSKRTVWQPGKNDPGKEAEMMRRLMLYLGAPNKKAAAALAVAAPTNAGTGARPGGGSSHLVSDGGAPVLVIADEFQRGWRTTGAALDRAGFAVKDRDMSRGVYFVRYEDADAGAAAKKRTWGDRLAFWRKSEIDPVKEYQIKVEGSGQETRVSVLGASGKRDASPSAQRILTLLQGEIK
ncbi:outer membrane protein assembly factor BamC [uncultured Thiodictyon sp.]|uniref:outer membrane protein assembly factor BamC n=1 Tax=uncultured Thiodictyon sp. TaxID=1846217 RepID=UPI0025FD0B26|nr:outer membrane protein assembly factor BamC [uncultured Thiodictyon sp.]